MKSCGSKFKKVWQLDQNGYLVKKLDKSGKQEVVDLHKEIQEHFGEVDFKSRINQSGEKQNEVMSILRKENVDMSSEVFDDVNNHEWVDLMTNLVKLKNAFVNKNGFTDAGWYKRVIDYLNKQKELYNQKQVKKEVKQEQKVDEVKK